MLWAWPKKLASTFIQERTNSDMSNLKKMIEQNSVLRVDFNNAVQKTEHGDIIGTKFYLIGVVQVAILYKDGSGERALINYPLLVGKDPFLRSLHGARAMKRHQHKAYDLKVKEIMRGLENAFLKVIQEGKFNNREISKILIVKYAGNSNHKNRRSEAVCQECQKASD